MRPGTLADIVLAVHAAFVIFVVVAFVLILAGAGRWPWVRHRTFRALHLGAILFVAAETLLGITCPLTRWEDWLRADANGERSFVGRWIGRLLYYDLPDWVFAVAYSAFALAVVWAWLAIPPHPRSPGR